MNIISLAKRYLVIIYGILCLGMAVYASILAFNTHTTLGLVIAVILMLMCVPAVSLLFSLIISPFLKDNDDA